MGPVFVILGCMLTVFLFLGVFAGIPALYIVHLPQKGGIRLRLKNASGVIVPNICVITNEHEVEAHTVRRYWGYPCFIMEQEMDLPFSKSGWQTFGRQEPHSLRVFKSGLHACMRMPPLLNGMLVFFLWMPIAAPICGLAALVDLHRRRRPLVVLHDVAWKHGKLVRLDITVPGTAFAEELVRLNGHGGLGAYQEKARKTQKRKAIVIVVLLLLNVLLFTLIFLLRR